jgi:hypothetical protein
MAMLLACYVYNVLLLVVLATTSSPRQAGYSRGAKRFFFLLGLGPCVPFPVMGIQLIRYIGRHTWPKRLPNLNFILYPWETSKHLFQNVPSLIIQDDM